jgi:glycosyltransferase involved in cell wall biosynthesis
MFDGPMGGTELMYNELMKRLPDYYKNKFSIFNYLTFAETNKKLIYWNQLSYDQEAVQPLKDPELVDKIDAFVFVSHWQSEQFRKIYNIPGYKSYVIKNACITSYDKNFGDSKDVVKICYTSTPWRGLEILLNSWEELQPENCELHIFSSTKIYGSEFSDLEEHKFDHLYERAKKLKGVVYRGSIPNDELLKEISSFHIMAYPCIFEETSCISVIEALSSGLRVITSNLGALPETTEGWAKIYPYLVNKEFHTIKFSKILYDEIQKFKSGELNLYLKQQKEVYSHKWSWNERIKEWINFLNTLIPKEF